MRVRSAVRSCRVRVVLLVVMSAKSGACWPMVGGEAICMEYYCFLLIAIAYLGSR
jgi:hypothetical protein